MTTGGWIFMIASWAIIIVVTVYSLSRSLGSKDDPGPGQGGQ